LLPYRLKNSKFVWLEASGQQLRISVEFSLNRLEGLASREG
jgi:hypothetical protein